MAYQKLVRDKIPAKIRRNGEVPHGRLLRGTHFDRALRQKLAEESFEIIEALTREEILSELADLQEAMQSLAKYHNIKAGEVLRERRRKRELYGSFRYGAFLESVEPGGQQ